MESCPTQSVLPLVGLAAEKIIRDWYMTKACCVPASLAKPSSTHYYQCAKATLTHGRAFRHQFLSIPAVRRYMGA
ncbi:MAG: hypothetical protein ACQESR_23390 [Planctomycetota bacterium]